MSNYNFFCDSQLFCFIWWFQKMVIRHSNMSLSGEVVWLCCGFTICFYFCIFFPVQFQKLLSVYLFCFVVYVLLLDTPMYIDLQIICVFHVAICICQCFQYVIQVCHWYINYVCYVSVFVLLCFFYTFSCMLFLWFSPSRKCKRCIYIWMLDYAC